MRVYEIEFLYDFENSLKYSEHGLSILGVQINKNWRPFIIIAVRWCRNAYAKYMYMVTVITFYICPSFDHGIRWKKSGKKFHTYVQFDK